MDQLQVSLNDVNKALNYVQYSCSVVKDFSLKSLQKVDEVESCIIDQSISTRQFVTDLSEKIQKEKENKPDKPIPSGFLHKGKAVQIQKSVDRFPILFPKESIPESPKFKITIASLFHESESEDHVLPVYDPLEAQYTRYSPPDLNGLVKIHARETFYPQSHKEWNIDNLSSAQIKQVIDQMITEYNLMCIDGKSEVEACKSLIPCFTGTLARWWELESSPALIASMEAEVLKDENGDVRFHEDGKAMNNIIGALTALIQQTFCGDDPKISDQNEMILMNLKCRNINQYEDFHRDWMQRIFMVKDPKNIL